MTNTVPQGNDITFFQSSLIGKPMLMESTFLEAVAESIDPTELKIPQARQSGSVADGTRNVIMKGRTAILPIHGPLSTRSSFWQMIFGGTSYEDIVNDLEAMQGSKDISHVILDVDSPGGTIDGVTDAEAAVHALRQSGVPVVTYCSGMNCSAAYWISSAAEYMFAAPTAMIGSIGVVAYTSTQKEKGYKAITSSGAKNKAKENYNLQEILDETEAVFQTAVITNRHISAAHLKDTWGEGAVFAAKMAVANRMVDSIANLKDLI